MGMQTRPRNAEEPEAVKRLDDAKNLGLTIRVERDYGPTSYFEHHKDDQWTEEMDINGRRYTLGIFSEKTVRVFMERDRTEYKLVDE